MGNKMKLGDQPVSLDTVRHLLGVPSVDKFMTSPLADSFQYIRYLVDLRKTEGLRLKFTDSVEGADTPTQIELRNSVVVLTDVATGGKVHLDVTRKKVERVCCWRAFLC